MPSIRGHACPDTGPFRDGNTRIQAVGHTETPRIVEIIFGSSTLDAGPRRAIDVEVLVSFTEPPGLILDNAEDCADVVTAPRYRKDFVGMSGSGREGLTIARVQIGGSRRQRRDLLPVDVEVEIRHAPASLVGDGDADAARERHLPVAVARPAAGSVANHQGVDRTLEAVADREEIADRTVDARGRTAVVVDAEPQQPRPGVLVGRDGQPDVGDDTRTGEIGKRDRLAGNRSPAVVVGIGIGVVARDAFGGEILEPRQILRIGHGPGRLRQRQSAAKRPRQHGGLQHDAQRVQLRSATSARLRLKAATHSSVLCPERIEKRETSNRSCSCASDSCASRPARNARPASLIAGCSRVPVIDLEMLPTQPEYPSTPASWTTLRN